MVGTVALPNRSPIAGRTATRSKMWTPWGLFASLLLPAILGVTAAVIGWGGVIGGLQADEQDRALRELAQWEQKIIERLAVVEDRLGSILSFRRIVGSSGEPDRVGSPFVDAPGGGGPSGGSGPRRAKSVDDSAAQILCELAAGMERQGDAEEALRLFGRAATTYPVADWKGPHQLARARALVRSRLAAGGDPQSAFSPLLELLSSGSSASEWVDWVSVPALAAVSGLRLARKAKCEAMVERFGRSLWAVRVPMDPTSAAAWARQEIFDPSLDVCRQFARVVAVLEDVAWRELPVGDQQHALVALGSDGPGARPRAYALVTSKRVIVLAPKALVAEVQRSAQARDQAEYRWAIQPSPQELERALARSDRLPVAVVGTPALPSARLLRLRWWLVGAAVLALLGGQFLVWRSVRREAELTSLRSDFVDLVGHELRTPLSVLTAKAEMLVHGDVPAGKRAEYQQSVYRAALRLGEQVNQVLDFSRLEKGDQSLEVRAVSTRAVVASALRRSRDALSWAGQRVDSTVPRKLPPIRGDAELIVQALRNLLHNAIRHAPGARIELRVVAEGAMTRLAVLDEGPGLGSIEPNELFVAFRRGQQRTAPGTGLGLAIVARSMQAMDGSVRGWDRASAVRGDGLRGAAFELTLPNAEEEPS